MLQINYKAWAEGRKKEVYEIVKRYGSEFEIAIIKAYLYADSFNRQLILQVWKKLFEKLYRIWEVSIEQKER